MNVQLDTEFCVLDGGWAGLCAAVAAARHGVKTVWISPTGVPDVSLAPAAPTAGLPEEWRLAHLLSPDAPNAWTTEPNLTLIQGADGFVRETDGHHIRSVTGIQKTDALSVTVAAALFADCMHDETIPFRADVADSDDASAEIPSLRRLCSTRWENLFPLFQNQAELGQISGTAAAFCRKYGVLPLEFSDAQEAALRQELLYDDCFLAGCVRELSDAPLWAELSCDDAVSGDILNLRNGTDRNHAVFGAGDQGFTMHRGATIEYHMDEPTEVSRIRIVFDADGENAAALSKVFYLEIETDGDWHGVLFENENVRRLVSAAVCRPVTGIRLTVMDTWGAENVHLFSFDFETL